jgi:hypothetical protein
VDRPPRALAANRSYTVGTQEDIEAFLVAFDYMKEATMRSSVQLNYYCSLALLSSSLALVIGVIALPLWR